MPDRARRYDPAAARAAAREAGGPPDPRLQEIADRFRVWYFRRHRYSTPAEIAAAVERADEAERDRRA